MKFFSYLVSTLLLAPALISAAPATEPGLSLLDRDTAFAAADDKCDTSKSTKSAASLKTLQGKIDALAKQYHTNENACPESTRTDFANEKSKTKRQSTKDNCVSNWTKWEFRKKDQYNNLTREKRKVKAWTGQQNLQGWHGGYSGCRPPKCGHILPESNHVVEWADCLSPKPLEGRVED